MPNNLITNTEIKKNPEQENNIYTPTNSFRIDGLTFEDLEGDNRVKIPTIEDETIKEERTRLKNTYNVQGDFIYVTKDSGEICIVPNTQKELRKLFETGFKFSNEKTNFLGDTQPTTLRERINFLEFKIKVGEQRLQENTELHLSIYKEKADKIGLKEVVNGYFIKIDGIEYNNFYLGRGSEKFPVNTDGKEFRLDRLRSIGYYDSNNGKLCYVSSDGSMHLGANSPENIKALTVAGYRPGNLFVPFSNGERPVNEDLRKLIDDVCSGKKPEELKAQRLAKVVNFAGTNKRLFGTFPATSNDELMKIYSEPGAEYEFDSANKSERQKLVEALRTETDQFGRTLKIYSINGREIVFRGREELPEIEAVKTGNTVLVGEKPVNLPKKLVDPYIKKATNNQTEGKETILAVKNLQGVLETAVLLGLKDEKILSLLEEIKKGNYTDRAIEMVDALVAMNFYSHEYRKLSGEMETDSEIIFIHALLGNDEAQKYVTRRLIEYQAYSEYTEDRRKQQFREFYGKYKGEALKVQELCIVHSTQHEPRKDGEGLYSIPTTFDATKGEYLRNSVHLTLNHKVHSHMSGNWEDKGYIIISPLSDTLAVNGDPEAINFDDTWWVMNPGQRFNFRGATVIAFSTDTNGELVDFDENLESGMVRIKPVGYTAKDLRTLMSMETLNYDRTTEVFSDMVMGYVTRLEYDRADSKQKAYLKELSAKRDRGEITWKEYDEAETRIEVARTENNGQDTEYNFTRIFNFNPYSNELGREISAAIKESLETGDGKNMEEVAEKIVKDTRLVERVRDSARKEVTFDLEDTILSLIEYIATEGERRISSLLNRVATEQTLERRGFQVARTTRENNSYGLGSGFSGSETASSAQFGSKVGRHDGSPESEITKRSLFSIISSFKKNIHDSDEAILPKLRGMRKSTLIRLEDADPSIRRMLYVSGITPTYIGNEFEDDDRSTSYKIDLEEIEE